MLSTMATAFDGSPASPSPLSFCSRLRCLGFLPPGFGMMNEIQDRNEPLQVFVSRTRPLEVPSAAADWSMAFRSMTPFATADEWSCPYGCVEMTPKIRECCDEAVQECTDADLRAYLAETDDTISLTAVQAVIKELRARGRKVRLHEVLAGSKPAVPQIVVPPEVGQPAFALSSTPHSAVYLGRIQRC